MNTQTSLKENILHYAKELRLPGTRKYYQDEIETATLSGSSYEQFILNLLKREYELRMENRKKSLIRRAQFPYKKHLEDLELDSLPKEGAEKIKTFKTLNFIENNRNIIFAGNSGTGKTHLAIALGIKACMAGYKVFYATVPSMITHLKESRSERILRQAENKFEKYDLIILDELGYISFDKEGSELLFTALSLRAGRKSTIITTNLSFDKWSEIFQDPVITAAMVDRLTHKAYLVNMQGQSYRIKETKKWMDKN